MEKYIFEDNHITMEQKGNFLITTIKDYPHELKKFNDDLYHSNMNDFESFKNRFYGVYEELSKVSEEPWFIVCKHVKYIECTSCSIDIRYNLSNLKISDMLFAKYTQEKKDAILKIEELISKRQELNVREEENLDDTVKLFNLNEKYKEYTGYKNLDTIVDNLKTNLDTLLQELKKINS